MIEPLRVDRLGREDLRAQPHLVPQFQNLLNLASDWPRELARQRFYIPFGSTLLAAFHETEPTSPAAFSGRLVGAALVNLRYDLPQVSFLSALAVQPDLQRQQSGIAPRLLKEAFTISTENDMVAIRLVTAKHSPWLRKYYGQYGFYRISLSNRVLEKILPDSSSAESR